MISEIQSTQVHDIFKLFMYDASDFVNFWHDKCFCLLHKEQYSLGCDFGNLVEHLSHFSRLNGKLTILSVMNYIEN